jgi:hypothetical protein
MDVPWRRDFDAARDPYTARNALGITTTGGGAPVSAEYITSSADATLTNERVLTNTASITWDFSTPGQAKANTTTGGGNVSNSGTPTSGQYAKWVTATTIQGVAPATVLSDIGAQPADADLTAIAALTGTNTIYYRSAANTWAAVTIGTGLTFTSGTLAASGGAGVATVSEPQGRLTLLTVTPVMTTTQSAKTQIYYTPYIGNLIPIWNGLSFTMTATAEISVATTDTSKNPSAIGSNKVNDWYVWNDAGVIRLCHGPDWPSDTSRPSTSPQRVSGILVNNLDITNGPGAFLGTYVGTTRSNASSQLDWIFGTQAAGGGPAFHGVWNAYNRRQFSTSVFDSTTSWTYAVANVWRAPNGNATMRAQLVVGLNEDAVMASYSGQPTPASIALIGVGLDSTTAAVGVRGQNAIVSNNVSIVAIYHGFVGIGFHFLSALERQNTVGSVTWIGFNANDVQGGLIVDFWA